MDWLKGMNSAVDYIEANLSAHIEYETLARIVGCSVYEFSRIFSFMVGISISEYIRRRRLSQAVFDIQKGGEKIIDIAYKYSYESQAAFTRAFKDLHGVPPLAVRKTDIPLKNYPAIKFILTIKGVNEMDFKIVEKPAFSVIGIKHVFNCNYDSSDEDAIRDIWAKTPMKTLEELMALAADGVQGLYGMYTRNYLGKQEYFVGVESNAEPPEGYVKHKVAASKWIVLEKQGNATGLLERFHTEWLPSSGYSRAQRSFPTVEYYGNKSSCAITFDQLWVPVNSAADIKHKFETAKAELAKLEAAKPRGNPVDIDLKAMAPHPNPYCKDNLTVNYTDDGKMVLHTPVGCGDGRMGTPQSFTAPIKIEMRAKTDGSNLRLYYGDSETNVHGAWVHLNGAGDDGKWYDYENLFTNDLSCENEHVHEGAAHVPIDEFIDVEWILGKTVMALKINGEIRVASCEYEYIEAFKHGFSVTGPVYPAPGRGSTITVESLRVTEL